MGWNILGNILLMIIVIGIIFVIILENRNPHKAIGWLIILVLLPGVGVLLYALLGQEKLYLRKINRHAPEHFDLNETPSFSEDNKDQVVNDQQKQLYDMVYHATLGSMLKADEVATFTNGIDKLYALLEDIKRAKRFIHIEYYRFLDDKSGQLVSEALKEKAAQGVKVRLLCDYVGSFSTRNSFFSDLRKHGIEVRQFLKVVFPSLRSDINFRDHRKIVVIDSNIGYIGGMNIADHYSFGNIRGTWRDAHFRITGLAVNGLQAAFMSDWYVASKIALSYDYFLNPIEGRHVQAAPNFSDGYVRAPKVGDVQMQTFTSGPTSLYDTLLQVWCRSIYGAKERIYIETPYFLPPDALLKALIGAALGGVEVYMVIPAASDICPLKFAIQSYYEELLEAGVKLYRYDGEFNHSKLLTIDGEVCFIGSANMDFRSLEHNFEITSVVYNQPFARQIEDMIRQDIDKYCTVYDLERWKRRSLALRFTQSFCRLFSPLM